MSAGKRVVLDIEFTEEQRALQRVLRDFLQREILPTVAEYDEREEFCWEWIEKLRPLQILGLTIPEEYGGGGQGIVTNCIVVEEISKVSPSLATTVIAHNCAVARPIMKYGTDEQKQRFLTMLSKGDKLVGFGITEPAAGTDMGGLRTTLRPEGDYYVANGNKHYISNGDIGSVYLLMGRLPETSGLQGLTIVIVERVTPGFSTGKKEKKMGLRSNPNCELIFEDCRIPKANLLGQEGGGFRQLIAMMNGDRVCNAAEAVGVAQAAFDYAMNYAHERTVGGQPVVSFQGIRWMLADVATRIEAARLLTYRAAERVDKGLPHAKEACIAKLLANEVVLQATSDAVQILGAYGYSREYPVERMMRDAKGLQIAGGTMQALRNAIAGFAVKEYQQR